MALNKLSLSGNIKAKELNYSDNFFNLKSEKVITSDSFSFNIYEALKDINDYSTNNYSNLFLSRKMRNSEWLSANIKRNEHQLDIITTLSFYSSNPDDVIEKGSWLYFDKNYEMWDINISSVPYLITYGRPTTNYSNYIFHINFIDENTCKICHTFGDIIFYLSVDEFLKVTFSKEDNEECVFQYSLDGNNLLLYKKVRHFIRDEVDEIVGDYFELYSLKIERLDDGNSKLILSKDLEQKDENLIFITNNVLDMDFYLDSSWVSYDRSQYIDSIDRLKSAFNLETQTLFHHQYNNEDTINFIPLKNNLTYKGNTIRGNNLSLSDIYYPDVDYRNYTSINSGLNQEMGNDNIILNFVFNDQEYEVNEGEDLHLTIPNKSLDTSNGIEPLWPYRYININDTKFIKNGAFGSDNPAFADKFKKYLDNNSSIVDENGRKIMPNNGTYLCTWLYKPSHEDDPVWMDRYYYPDMIHKSETISKLANVYDEETFKRSKENIIDNYYLNDEASKETTKKKIRENVYFDKISDVVIEPGCSYIYSRLSKEMIDENLENMSSNLIATAKNQTDKVTNLSDYFVFDNENYKKIDYKSWNKTNSINFNTDIYLDAKKRMGIQLFGSDYTDGFNIQNRKDLAPFHYYATEDDICLLNNKYQLMHKFSVYEKYKDHIVKFFLGNPFDDVVVLTGINLYIFTYDLRLKTRISLITSEIKTETEDGEVIREYNSDAVYGLEKLHLYRQDETISLLNYPYGNNGMDMSIKDDAPFGSEEIAITSYYEICPPVISNNKEYISFVYGNEYELIPSQLVEMISQSNSISYRNNLYIPFEENILKIILCPDTEKDFEIFTEEIRENYPAACRILNENEYYLNFLKKSTDKKEEITLQNGFIEVENKIKNIYINENDEIFGFNYDKIAAAPDGDTVYGLYAYEKYINSGGWYWLFNQSMSKIKSNYETSKYAEFASMNTIDFIKFNEKGEMALIRNFNNFKDNNNADNNKRIDIYDKTKKRIYTHDLSLYDEVIGLDSYNFIDEGHVERSIFAIFAKSGGSTLVIGYLSDTKEMITFNTYELPGNHNKNFVEATNSNALMRYRDSNVLYFNLHAPSPYLYDHIATIKWDLKDIQTGWYNINVSVDLDKAKFEVRINDEIYETITEDTHSWFKPFMHGNGSIFNATYYIGCLGKKYGTTINKILNNSFYDPYICKNSKIENLSIYNRALKYNEYQAMRLKDKNINRLILTLPCGARNSVDEIVRYFKYNSAGAISNKVKINISGTGLETQGEFDLLKKEIMTTLENTKDCLVDVKEIEFI